jgi:protocatechuate 3,4-dioxygenase beta subunit
VELARESGGRRAPYLGAMRALTRAGLAGLAALAAALAAACGSASAASCTATLSDSFGPFGRGMPPVRSSIGHGHVLSGRVLSALGCRPLARARVELWQSGANGQYTTAGSATVFTDAQGRFRFEGPMPPAYEGLPPHIHLRVLARGHKPLLTRYVVAEGERAATIVLVLEPDAL